MSAVNPEERTNDQPRSTVRPLDIDIRRHPDPLVVTIFGASGDLTHRKILPAFAALAAQGGLPDSFAIVGVARSKLSNAEFRKLCLEAAGPADSLRWRKLVENFHYISGDYDRDTTFTRLKSLLASIDERAGTKGNRLYYLATIPGLFAEVAASLARHGLNVPAEGGSFARLVIEKPFGADLKSAQALDADLHSSFEERQIFRIDHYMGKETVLNVLALRFANSIFEPIWNRRYVDHIQLTVAEELGVEHRGGYYEGAGALRDIMQNHVMQVISLTLMEPPATMGARDVRDEKVKLLRSIVVPDRLNAADDVVRAQYAAGQIEGAPVPAYRDEEGISKTSQTETYVAMRLAVDNWRWAGVPVYVRTGKRLRKRATEVTMVFQRPPHLPFAGRLARDLRPDALTLRIQPDEGIALSFGAKVPGPDFRVRSVSMDFSYQDAFPGPTADAYERLLLDAMIGDPMLFIRTDEVDQAWTILDPVQRAFADNEAPLARYPAGSWGPLEANRLLDSSGRQWRNP